MRTLPVAGICLLVGCAAVDRQHLAHTATFIPVDGGFVFKSEASTTMQEDSPGAERNRLTVMSQFNERNATCPSGYIVTDRQVINKPKTLIGVKTLKDIVYKARCK